LVLAFLIGVVSLGCGATGRLARIDGDGIDPPSREPSRYFPHDRDAFDESELVGEATWYGGRFQGRSTANGERFDMHLMTAAHRELPFNTVVRVVRDDDRRSVVVRVNDRGPGSPHRVIDLSWAAAHEIGMVEQGHADVQLEILHWGNGAVYE
jgi:rare lipoprotein A